MSIFGGGSGHQDENESAPTDDSFSFDTADSKEPLAPQTFHEPPVSSIDNSVPNMGLPLVSPEVQPATPSEPYGSLASTVTDNVLQPTNELPEIGPLSPDASSDSIGPIDPDTPTVNIEPPAPTVPNNVSPSLDNDDRTAVAAFIAEAHQRIDRGEILPTLFKLSQYYNAPQFTPDEAKQVHYMLMQLAGEVIYIHPEKYFNLYTVQPGDTITSIAGQHQVPWQFIAKINGMTAPYHVNPGEKIKVVRGPFNAEIHLDKYELTLWLPVGNDVSQSLYAGTFPIGLGGDCPKLQGDYIVDEKFINPEYPKFSQNPTTFGPGDANNPYGSRLLALSCVSDQNHVKIGIHGTNNPQYIRQSVPYGFICLGARDINDLYDILSVGSRIKIER